MTNNPYLTEVQNNLPRLLALYDNDSTSRSYGMGDRYHWAWGLIDFGNGTFQGAAHGLSLLWVNNIWPYETDETVFFNRIDSMFEATKVLTRSDGSLEEAFPREGSYCVTALVAFDLLCTIELLSERTNKQNKSKWVEIVNPLIKYLIRFDENHAIISNHLATAVAALVRWHKITNDSKSISKANHLLDRILSNQSDEGWYKEYEGADPGYQSLCLYYLTDVYQQLKDQKLFKSISKSFDFLKYFVHPDGSFGGIYGSRCTRFYYPVGPLAFASKIDDAQAIAYFMSESIKNKNVVTLSSIDEPNLIPMFNSYALAAVLYENIEKISEIEKLPSKSNDVFRKYFHEAGLLIDKGLNHYTIVSTYKGGVTYHFSNEKFDFINTGVVVKNKFSVFASTQNYNINNRIHFSENSISIISKFVRMPKDVPTPFQFLIIRLLSTTFFRSVWFREWVKKKLVKMLITNKIEWPGFNKRTIKLGSNIEIDDKTKINGKFEIVKDQKRFIPIHMASQGYWQLQDEKLS